MRKSGLKRAEHDRKNVFGMNRLRRWTALLTAAAMTLGSADYSGLIKAAQETYTEEQGPMPVAEEDQAVVSLPEKDQSLVSMPEENQISASLPEEDQNSGIFHELEDYTPIDDGIFDLGIEVDEGGADSQKPDPLYLVDHSDSNGEISEEKEEKSPTQDGESSGSASGPADLEELLHLDHEEQGGHEGSEDHEEQIEKEQISLLPEENKKLTWSNGGVTVRASYANGQDFPEDVSLRVLTLAELTEEMTRETKDDFTRTLRESAVSALVRVMASDAGAGEDQTAALSERYQDALEDVFPYVV